MRAFVHLAPADYRGSFLIVDIDGTLVPDRATMLPEEARRVLGELSRVATVHLYSNVLPERTAAFARDAGVYALVSRHKKPSRRVIEDVASFPERIVVIGDKMLTDGLFAANIGAEFVRVLRIRGEGESIQGRLAYALDAALRPFFQAANPLLPYLALMRPTQWVKNVLVFAPLFFAGAAFSIPLLAASALAFVSFSLAASALYVLNDYRDRETDRAHPTKRFRPIASGRVRVQGALLLMFFLGAMSAIVAVHIPALLPALAAYFFLNAAYSFYVKRVPVADVASVSASYVLRVLAGGAATGIFVSPWLICCVFFGALILVTGKRRAEFARASRRAVLNRYSKKFLDGLLICAAALALLSYVLYAAFGGHGPLVAFSAVAVACAILRLLYLALTSDDAEYPEALALKDPAVLALCGIWLALMFLELYS